MDRPKEAFVTWDAHWRHLANTTEPSLCGGDAAFLSDYFDRLFIVITTGDIKCKLITRVTNQ